MPYSVRRVLAASTTSWFLITSGAYAKRSSTRPDANERMHRRPSAAPRSSRASRGCRRSSTPFLEHRRSSRSSPSGSPRVGVQRGEASRERRLAVLGAHCVGDASDLGRGGRRVDVERRATREGDAMDAGEIPRRCGDTRPPANPTRRSASRFASYSTERGVLAVQRDELVVGAQLGDLAVDDHAHAVGVVRGVQAMRDGDDGTTPQDRTQRALEVTRRARVEQRGRLVEHERVGVAQDEPRERQLLGLGGRDGIARRAEFGVESARAGAPPTRGRRPASRARFDLVVAGLGPRERQVVANRADEDVVLLGDERDVTTQDRRAASGRARPRRPAPIRCAGASIPASSRPMVDLPAPEGPTMARRSPGRTVSDTPFSTSWPGR